MFSGFIDSRNTKMQTVKEAKVTLPVACTAGKITHTQGIFLCPLGKAVAYTDLFSVPCFYFLPPKLPSFC